MTLGASVRSDADIVQTKYAVHAIRNHGLECKVSHETMKTTTRVLYIRFPTIIQVRLFMIIWSSLGCVISEGKVVANPEN